jgi:DNA-binding MarR family transcriptional regulator
MRQYQVLLLVSASGESNLSVLCRKMGIAPSTGTELIDRMIESGYLERLRQPEDHRQVAITVSQKGRDELDLRKQGLISIFEDLLETLPADRRSDFVSSFESIADILSELPDEA